VGKVKSGRVYRSGLRLEQARRTQTKVLEAAERLFGSRGYAGTTIGAIATEAGVAVDTVYAGFGTKRQLLERLMDIRVGGDDQPLAILDRPGPQAMRQDRDQRRQLTGFAEGIATTVGRVSPVDEIMRSAAAVDAEIAASRSRMQALRFKNMRTMVGWVAANGPLRGDMSQDDAATVIWTLTSPEVHRLLTAERGWTAQRYSAWLAETLIRTLLP
jgi:AcrR family transcriptional regulator